MTSALHARDSGIEAVGEIPFGSHFCQFYRTKQDLADILVSYFAAGLRNHEACTWVTSEPFGAEEAEAAMRAAVPDFQAYLARGQIEIWDYKDWYLASGGRPSQLIQRCLDREKRALDNGYAGLRATGNTFWLEPEAWDEFVAYEAELNRTFGQHRIIALCSYCLDRCQAEGVLDVCRNHHFTLARRAGQWERIENSSLRIAQEDLGRLHRELEQRVDLRTAELEEALRGRDELLARLGHEPGAGLVVRPSLRQAAPPAAGRKILVVDDSRNVADSMARFLKLSGHDVRVAYDAEAALDLAAVFRPDVGLLDIGLPRIDGYELARRLRADPHQAEVLLIAFTAHGRDEDRERGKRAGFDHYLVKPLDFDILRALLDAPASQPSSESDF